MNILFTLYFPKLTTHRNPRSKSRWDGETGVIKVSQTELNSRLVHVWTGGLDDPVGPVLIHSVTAFLHRALRVRRTVGSNDYFAAGFVNDCSSFEDIVTIGKKSLKDVTIKLCWMFYERIGSLTGHSVSQYTISLPDLGSESITSSCMAVASHFLEQFRR